uniref:Caspase family p10 domain-containing protein n=1 Tax=Photinus pyralis TaxID=7054 RepID=A0A1Y1LKQ5_PHOPY
MSIKFQFWVKYYLSYIKSLCFESVVYLKTNSTYSFKSVSLCVKITFNCIKRNDYNLFYIFRGKFPDFGAAQSRIEHDSGIRTPRPARVMLRSCSDMLIAHSTLPGDASHRDVYLGTWYINLFCKYMMLRAHDTHLEDIFKLIDSELAHLRSAEYTMQTSMYTNIGFKTCYVHPGIYLDGNEIRRIDEDAVPEVNDNVA